METLLSFVGGAILTIVFSPWFKGLFEKWRLRPSWKTFYKCLTNEKNISAIQENKPDVLIGLNNGIVPASILATNLGIESLYYFHNYPSVAENGTREIPKFHDIDIDLTDQKILIIDDQLHEGHTMDTFYRHLIENLKLNEANISRLALFKGRYSLQKLEFESPEKLRSPIRKVPWSFSSEHKSNAQHLLTPNMADA